MEHLALSSGRLIDASAHITPLRSRSSLHNRPVLGGVTLRLLQAERDQGRWRRAGVCSRGKGRVRAAGRSEPVQYSKIDESDVKEEVDIVVVGAGLGGLCCAALLAKYGLSVVVCESHTIPGGAAHAFERKGFHFDSGPSFHAGLSMKRSLNPLKQVLDILGEAVPCVSYKTWIGYLPGDVKFTFSADAEAYRKEIAKQGGKVAVSEWEALERKLAPLAMAAAALPASALRRDPGVVLTVSRFLPGLLKTLPWVSKLLQPFSVVVDQVVSDPFLRRLIDLECFVLSGMLADSTITAEMAFMFFERSRKEGTIDYPLGGGGAVVQALVRGLIKHGGKLLLGTHVEEIIVKEGTAKGVRLREKGRTSVQEHANSLAEEDKSTSDSKSEKKSGPIIMATKGVISNCSIWDTAKLLPIEFKGEKDYRAKAEGTEMTGSFMHLHLGIDATGLPKELECHHLIVNDWERGIEAPQNVIIVSIPSVFDASLAPPGKHTVHCYSAGNEPYEIWKGLDRRSKEYQELKDERSQVGNIGMNPSYITCKAGWVLWRALEKVIPDIRQRAEVTLVGTPLTHERYLRRSMGTYGPAVRAGKQDWPGPQTSVPGLYQCGDSTMPGIGVPAVAASGLMAANAILSVWDQLDMLKTIEDAAKQPDRKELVQAA